MRRRAKVGVVAGIHANNKEKKTNPSLEPSFKSKKWKYQGSRHVASRNPAATAVAVAAIADADAATAVGPNDSLCHIFVDYNLYM